MYSPCRSAYDLKLQLSLGGKRRNQRDIQRRLHAGDCPGYNAGVVPALDKKLLFGHVLEIHAVLRARFRRRWLESRTEDYRNTGTYSTKYSAVIVRDGDYFPVPECELVVVFAAE